MTQNYPGPDGPTAAAGATPPPRGDALDTFFANIRTLGIVRRRSNRWLGGVCAGVGARFRIDPLLVRAILVGLLILGGVGVPLYLIGWALLPDEQGRIRAEMAIRHGDGGGIVLIVLVLISIFPSGSLWWRVPVTVLALGAGVWLLTSARRPVAPTPDGASGPAPGGYPGSAPSPGTAPFAAAPTAGSGQPAPAWAVTSAPGPYPGPMTAGAHPGAAGGSYGNPAAYPNPAAYGNPAGYPGRYAPVPPAPPAPPARLRRPGGFAVTLMAVGASILAYVAGRTLAEHEAWTQGTPYFFGSLWALVALAVICLVVGLRGWRAPLLGVVTILVAIQTSIAAVVPSVHSGVGDRTWQPTSSLATAYDYGAGNVTLDLRDLPGTVADGRTTSVHLGVGNVTIYPPADTTVALHATVGLGDLTVRDSAGGTVLNRSGGGIDETTTIGSGPNSLRLDVSLGLGELTVKE